MSKDPQVFYIIWSSFISVEFSSCSLIDVFPGISYEANAFHVYLKVPIPPLLLWHWKYWYYPIQHEMGTWWYEYVTVHNSIHGPCLGFGNSTFSRLLLQVSRRKN